MDWAILGSAPDRPILASFFSVRGAKQRPLPKRCAQRASALLLHHPTNANGSTVRRPQSFFIYFFCGRIRSYQVSSGWIAFFTNCHHKHATETAPRYYPRPSGLVRIHSSLRHHSCAMIGQDYDRSPPLATPVPARRSWLKLLIFSYITSSRSTNLGGVGKGAIGAGEEQMSR